MGSAELLDGLRAIFPEHRLLLDRAQLAAYESDALTAFAVAPRVVVVAESADEVVRTVRLCHDLGVPFVPRGSGTSLSGGSLPVAGGVVIALNRLNRILELDPERRIAVVEPGVVNLQVSRAAAPYGLHYAPDPSSQQVCTIGGNVAFNSGGAHCLKYGMTANHVLGLKAVLPTGEVVELGGDGLETIGPDWTGLFVGSEGLFGVALEITLRLLPIAESFYTVLAGYATIEAAGEAVARIVAAGLLPAAMEIMDATAIEAAVAAVRSEYPPGAEAVLIVELEGARDLIDADRRRLDALIRESGAIGVHRATSPEERATIWKGRKSAFSAVGRISPDYIVQDGVVPRSRLGAALRRIGELGAEFGLRIANVFHAGDGNLHPLILYDGQREGELERAEALAGRILDLCIELGGSITGEHGVGMEKRAFLPRMFGPDDLDAFHRLHRAMDPKAVANRGKMFPPAEAVDAAAGRPGGAPASAATAGRAVEAT
ncbi:MAG TPA: FAD-linked oxidase C-terminal domain-containing protein [Longimicrobiales bacterium]